MRTLSPALAVLLCFSSLSARQERLTCGTHPDKWKEEVQLHRSADAQPQKLLRRAGMARLAGERDVAGVTVRPDIGNIAILDDADGVVSRPNPFNLDTKTLRFLPIDAAGAAYTYEVSEGSYDASLASGNPVNLGDDDTREIALPFVFPFFGVRHSSIFLNSDGNLTFSEGDVAITDRSLGRFTSGAPRIAGLFRDLDPTRAGGVYVVSSSGGVVFSWVQVPEYSSAGTGPLQTFQIRLFPDGRIEFAFSGITTEEAVVGITPGGLKGSASVVSFVNTPSGQYVSTVAERFTDVERIDIFSVAQKFYLNHEDSYDYLVIYNNLGIDADDGAVAFEVTIRNNRSGYGDEQVDVGAETGSRRRLQALLNMGPLDQYPRDANSRVPTRFSVGDTPLTTIAHETGHLFLAFASVRDPNNPTARPMLGHQTAHWNFTFNSDASLLEGNRIQDNGTGASPRFQTTATVEGFSALDQYLMGLRSSLEVPDMFYVANATGTGIRGLPRVGATFDGDRRDVRIDEIISAEGRRTPDHTVAQRRFRFAFILITAEGKDPSPGQIEQLEDWRVRFEEYFSRATSGRAVADTNLKRALHVSTWPAAGVLAGSSGTGTVSLESPAEAPVTVLLRPANGNVRTPASVTIPAGAAEASFTLAGLREGVDELVAEASDARYEAVHSRIQVAPASAVSLTVVAGNHQIANPGRPITVQLRATDINELPYAGLNISVLPADGSHVDRMTAVTDQEGLAEFSWTPGSGVVNELYASIEGGPAATVAAVGRPAAAPGAVVNAASWSPGLSAGGLGTIFGANLTGSTIEVLVNGRSAPVLFSSTRQINFQVPFETSAGTADLLIRNNAGTSDVLRIPVAAVQPGVFFDSASGYGAVVVAGSRDITAAKPASRGDVIEIYATGLGAVQSDGNGLRLTTVRPAVFVGGAPAEVTFSGLAPGFIGLYQINARIPGSAPTGLQSLVVNAEGLRSNEVRVEIR